MKSLLIAFTLIANVALAEEVRFGCEFTDVTYRRQFSLENMTVNFEDGVFAETHFDFNLRSAGLVPKFDSYHTTRSGTAKVFEVGTLGQKRSIQLSSAIKGAELEYIGLVIDFPGVLSSKIRFADGTVYSGTCTSH